MTRDPQIAKLIARVISPEPRLTVSEWSDQHRVLSTRATNEAGRWRTARTPYLREIMDALSAKHPAQEVVFMKGAQIGATEAGCNWIGYVIHHAPGPLMIVWPDGELSKRNSRARIDPLLRETPALAELVPAARGRDAGNTMMTKNFPGGVLVIAGAGSPAALKSTPVRYLFLDEVDTYPFATGQDGDPIALAVARTSTFTWRRKVFFASTPKIAGLSRIEAMFDASDQRRYFVPCPHCGYKQYLIFERLRWDKGQPATAAYVCEGCERPIPEHHKTAMLAGGEWRPTAVSPVPRRVGYHLSSLYSPLGWKSWEMIAQQWEESTKSPAALQQFYNEVLGLTWREAEEAPDWVRLFERRERWALTTVPAGVGLLTAGADVQANRIEVSVWGWGRNKESWLIEHVVFDGGPNDPACWSAMKALLAREWTHASGVPMRINRLAIDTGGHHTTQVYAWARGKSPQVMAIKGAGGYNRASPVTGPTEVEATEGGRKIKRGVRLWQVSVDVFKSQLYGYLRLSGAESADGASPEGFVHLPSDVDPEWIKQLVAEQLVITRDRTGRARYEWRKDKYRNEALDCRVYAAAAAWVIGVDRWTAARWDRQMIALTGHNSPVIQPVLDVEPAHAPGAPVPEWKIQREPRLPSASRYLDAW